MAQGRSLSRRDHLEQSQRGQDRAAPQADGYSGGGRLRQQQHSGRHAPGVEAADLGKGKAVLWVRVLDLLSRLHCRGRGPEHDVLQVTNIKA